LTFFLLTVILATATNHRLVGHNAALAVSGTIALDGLFAAPVSGASMNPAHSFGPALVDGQLGTYWIGGGNGESKASGRHRDEREDQSGRTPAVDGYAACSTAPMANPARVPVVTTARNSSPLRTGPLSE
jgi:hypothetical protein